MIFPFSFSFLIFFVNFSFFGLPGVGNWSSGVIRSGTSIYLVVAHILIIRLYPCPSILWFAIHMHYIAFLSYPNANSDSKLHIIMTNARFAPFTEYGAKDERSLRTSKNVIIIMRKVKFICGMNVSGNIFSFSDGDPERQPAVSISAHSCSRTLSNASRQRHKKCDVMRWWGCEYTTLHYMH